ncbi:integrase [Pedobacter africanus]|uniref:site-specific integrase n=1 Tax=Pedobacter africanus TaxID=151894 RepID=UPI0033979886
MMERSFGLLYYLKQPKNVSAKERFIYCRITVDGIPKEFSTKRKCSISKWNQDCGRMEGSSQEAKSLNAYLDSVTNAVYKAKKQLLDEDKSVTAEAIRNVVLGIEEEKYMLMEIYGRYNSKARTLVGLDYVKETVDRFDRIARIVGRFIRAFYKVDDLELRRLDYEFIDELANYIRVVQGCSKNTTQRYLATFKSVIIDCKRKGWIQTDPFAEFSMKKEEVEVKPLSANELERLQKEIFSCDRLNSVRDVFVFCCYTGLAYADLKRLSWADISKGENGDRWIRIKRKKTGTLSVIPLLPMARRILFLHGMKRKCRASGKALMVLSNQKMNAYLKEIGDLCGFKHDVHAHMARHTFATTVALANGVSIESVSRMLGHKSIRQTQHYAKVLDKKLAEDMAKLRTKLASKSKLVDQMQPKISKSLKNIVMCQPVQLNFSSFKGRA